MTFKVVDTDVLVVGSGIAGLVASIEARRLGVDVILISKSPTGLANCSAYSGGVLLAPVGALNKENYFRSIITAGKFVNNQRLVEVLVNEAGTLVSRLQEFGVKLIVNDGRCRIIEGTFPMKGVGLVNPLVTYAKSIGVRTLEHVMITSLLSNGAVNGAVSFDIQSGRRISINAKSIILATGGACQIYQRNDNPVRITGDGYAMAYELGLPLIDMEFVQFWPIGSAEPGYPIFLLQPPQSLLEYGALQNVKGEDIAKKYKLDPKLAYSTQRDAWAVAIKNEIIEGRGEEDAVFLDLTQFCENLEDEFIKLLLKFFKGFPMSKRPLHISPLAHFFMGGILINEKCETSLPGLFAVGEVSGGIHGANRVGGNALTECVIYGSRAGFWAAEYAKSNVKVPADEMQIKQKFKKIDEIAARNPSRNSDPKVVRNKIQEIMWKKVGVIRSQRWLIEAQEDLKQIEKEGLSSLYGHTPHEMMEVIEVENLFTVANLVAIATATRTESRGAHYRIDYPYEDNKSWLKNIILTREHEKIKINMRPVVMTKLFP
jgi:succinate dehydrogenase/fumarate reductase flavoprotein subunit